jgi:hypothetical protein
MDIKSLSKKLNESAKSDGHHIAQLPTLRKKYLRKERLPDHIFDDKTVFPKEKYAFHYGGRDEMQFNVGEETINGIAITRYCLAISLESSRSLTNPPRTLLPFWKRFKEVLQKHPEYSKQYKIWYHTRPTHENHSVHFLSSENVDDTIFAINNFICIGNYISKPISDLDENDISTMLYGLDSLLPIYNYCVLKRKDVFDQELRLIRVCWNENEWKLPSGPQGKSKDPNSHENKYGYGHEEWIFDLTKIINGYHYCGLQAVENGRDGFVGKHFNVKLYTHNSETDEYYWVGEIKRFEVISEELANAAYIKYKENGWIDEMKDEVAKIDGDSTKFLSLHGKWQFNVRFRPEDIQQFIPLKALDNFYSIINTHRYQFIKNRVGTIAPIDDSSIQLNRKFSFKPGKGLKSTKTRVSVREKKTVEIVPVHDTIQNELYHILVNQYGQHNVSYEGDTGMRTKIDLVVHVDKAKYALYEVKSYPSVMISIRNAIGQLLEYAYWPEAISEISELIIVSHIPIDNMAINYLDYLRKSGIKIHYQHYNLETKILGIKQ